MVAQEFKAEWDRACAYLQQQNAKKGKAMDLGELLHFAVGAMTAVKREFGNPQQQGSLSAKGAALAWLYKMTPAIKAAADLLRGDDQQDLFDQIDWFREEWKKRSGEELHRTHAAARLILYALRHDNLIETLLEEETET